MLRRENEKITLTKKDVECVLRELEFVLVSLERLNGYYGAGVAGDLLVDEEYCKAVTDFIDSERVTNRLARMRAIVSSKFDDTLGEDDMDDLERVLDKIDFWEKPRAR